MPAYDLVLQGGTIIDGLRTARFVGDIAVVDGKIAAIGSDISASDAKRVIDVCGKVVAPGVVDLHTHYDSQIFWDS